MISKLRSGAVALGVAAVNFHCSLLGDPHTKANVGTRLDAAKAHAVGKGVQDRCRAEHLPRGLTLTFSKYSESLSQSLVQAVQFLKPYISFGCKIRECLGTLRRLLSCCCFTTAIT